MEENAQLVEHLARVFEHVAVRVATELVASRAGFALASAILLPGVARTVVAVAVELDGQTLLGPAAVDAASTCDAVGLRERKALGPEHAEEAPLKRAEGDVDVAVQHSP